MNAKTTTLKRLASTTLAVAAAGLVVACGPSYEAADEPDSVDAIERTDQRLAEERVEVQITNTIVPNAEAQIYAVPESGTRNFLGIVEGGDDEGIIFIPTPDIEERYRLVAVIGGEEIESELFVPANVRIVTWNLETNEITHSESMEVDEDEPDADDRTLGDDPDNGDDG